MNRIDAELLSHARGLRAHQTATEKLVWNALRGRRFLNLKWRRQVPWRGFVLDFYCEDLALALELDGGHHLDPAQVDYDERRRRALAADGIRVHRISNVEAKFAVKDLFEIIRTEFEATRH